MSGFSPPSASTFPSKLCVSLHHDTTTMRENVEKLKNNFLSFSFTTLTTEGRSKFMEWDKSSKEKMKISKNDKKQRIFRFPCFHVSSRGFFCEMLLWFLDMLSLFFIVLSNGADEDEISKTHFGRSLETDSEELYEKLNGSSGKVKIVCVWSWPDDDIIIC